MGLELPECQDGWKTRRQGGSGGWELVVVVASVGPGESFVLGAIKPLQGSENKSSDLELSMEVSFLEG